MEIRDQEGERGRDRHQRKGTNERENIKLGEQEREGERERELGGIRNETDEESFY